MWRWQPSGSAVDCTLERPYLRPCFYENVEWKAGDRATRDEVLAMAEVMLNNFAFALMHLIGP